MRRYNRLIQNEVEVAPAAAEHCTSGNVQGRCATLSLVLLHMARRGQRAARAADDAFLSRGGQEQDGEAYSR